MKQQTPLYVGCSSPDWYHTSSRPSDPATAGADPIKGWIQLDASAPADVTERQGASLPRTDGYDAQAFY